MDLQTAMAKPWSGASRAADEGEETEATAERLLQRFAEEGDEEAFGRLVAKIGERLYAFIRRFLGEPHQAEDVYQTVLMKVALHAREFDHRSLFATWLYRIARNACLDVLRRERRVRLTPLHAQDSDGAAGGEEMEWEAKSPLPEEQVSRDELARIIAEAVERLPEDQREVFLLREEADLTFEQIGAMLGCGKETAKSRMRYALRRLQAELRR
ncbi:MAG: sigma-70 family RNA polymerase sigma factor, partial [Planctomycetota bacterium]|nr:sigma-70 family RNA polymerase sigma factor [Planctomycetota bacterium]